MSDDVIAPIKGRYLSDNELRQASRELEQWMTPTEMEAQFDALSAISDEYFFIQPGLQFIRDAYIAAVFGQSLDAKHVRLCNGERPDFEVEVDGSTRLYEATEVNMPGRRRGDEYKAALGKPPTTEHVEQDEIEAGIDAVPGALRAAAEAKATKAARLYDPSWGLVISQNIPTYGCDRDEVENCFEAATHPAAGAFAEVWVQWGRDAYRTWPQGGPRPPRQVDEPPTLDLSEIFDGR